MTRLYWGTATGCYVDSHGRTAARCRADANVAADLADTTRQVVAAITSGTIILGRQAGRKLVTRFELNAAQLDAIAERDLAIAVALSAEDAANRARAGALQ